jgi:hypothetical protein
MIYSPFLYFAVLATGTFGSFLTNDPFLRVVCSAAVALGTFCIADFLVEFIKLEATHFYRVIALLGLLAMICQTAHELTLLTMVAQLIISAAGWILFLCWCYLEFLYILK